MMRAADAAAIIGGIQILAEAAGMDFADSGAAAPIVACLAYPFGFRATCGRHSSDFHETPYTAYLALFATILGHAQSQLSHIDAHEVAMRKRRTVICDALGN